MRAPWGRSQATITRFSSPNQARLKVFALRRAHSRDSIDPRGDLTMRVDQIDPARTAMIVVDMQNDFVAAGAPMETPAARAMVPKLAEALKMARAAGMRVIYTAHVHRRDGC